MATFAKGERQLERVGSGKVKTLNALKLVNSLSSSKSALANTNPGLS